MEESAKETVIIVHGTWAAPEPGVKRWYQPGDGVTAAGEFVSKLDAALQKRGSPARCWAHCTQAHQIFHWSGENSWIARTRAAAELGKYVLNLRKEGWCCHIVAHSHGGNVVLEALPQTTTALPSNLCPGKIVTLGTPFMNTMSPILKTIRKNRSSLTTFMALLFFSLLYSLLYQLVRDFIPTSYANFPNIIFSFLLLLMFLVTQHFSERKNQTAEHVFAEVAQMQLKFLAVGSMVDEPWQILHHMRNVSNPMAVQTNLIRYLISSTRARLSRNREVFKLTIGGGAWIWLLRLIVIFALFLVFLNVGIFLGFWSAMLSSGLAFIVGATITFLGLSLPVVIIMLPLIVTYIVRSRGWSVVVAIAMGLEGYPYQLPFIEQKPSFLPGNFVKYENMPTGAQEHALAMRGCWVDRRLDNITQTFSKLVVTSADMTSLLQTIEEDQTLVHAAYYTDNECIARIADWIAGRG
jgi:hypothetical protein